MTVKQFDLGPNGEKLPPGQVAAAARPAERDEAPGPRPKGGRGGGRGPVERLAFLALALLAFLLAVPGWVRGARYTVDGWAFVVQVVANVMTVPVRVELPTGWNLVGLVMGVGLAYSLAEVAARPRMAWLRWGLAVVALAVVVWLIVLGTDIFTTIVGVLATPPTAWPTERWIAERPVAAALYGIVLTFYPEGFTLLAAYLVRLAFGR